MHRPYVSVCHIALNALALLWAISEAFAHKYIRMYIHAITHVLLHCTPHVYLCRKLTLTRAGVSLLTSLLPCSRNWATDLRLKSFSQSMPPHTTSWLPQTWGCSWWGSSQCVPQWRSARSWWSSTSPLTRARHRAEWAWTVSSTVVLWCDVGPGEMVP